ncbi:GAF domain-containing protein [Hymenobacter persicinus]|uniref:GAF domain-containing protein n=1 Tax=Hymenobacter persicinus TaxID=2025506 RepID=A0A4Q5L9M0_9BACT|nr:GAF domain-containing protein [Hymenobacter persicinus]RYU78243.1 GAF domain-containing protein [Hymenobacter persicinus]
MNTLPTSLIPDNDPQRLRSLHQYQILNTTPEPIFDEYVALAAQLFNLPISLISLVDEQQVFFKSNVGLPDLERLDRADSLCSAAILQNQVLTYTDLSREGCDLVNPFVAQAAGLRFYAGAALHMPDGENIGSLCVIGREARTIAPEEETLLAELAGLVSMTMALRWGYLHQGQVEAWQAKQHELTDLLHDSAAFARYLTMRTGTISASARDLHSVRQRLQELRDVLTAALAEQSPAPGR